MTVVLVVTAVAVKHCQVKDWYESLCFIFYFLQLAF